MEKNKPEVQKSQQDGSKIQSVNVGTKDTDTKQQNVSKVTVVKSNVENESQATSVKKSKAKTWIKIKDNGPGISPYLMKETLTSFGLTKEMKKNNEGGPFSLADHGINLKLSSLRLGETCLIISKTSPQNQVGVQYLTIGFISVQFHKDLSEEYLSIPIICYQIKNKESFLPLTDAPELVLEVMKKYTHSCFSSEKELMSYTLNKMGR